jgi:fluoride exporter
MNGFLPVMIGGALGAGARYGVGLWSLRMFGTGFPWGTLIVNLIGGLVMGLIIGRGAGEPWRLFAGVGVLGGFTTFSAFGLESWSMLARGATAAALGYILASVLGAVLLTGLGLWIART